MNSTHLRDRACRLAQDNPIGALLLAREVPDAWFRTQALAAVVQACDGDQVERIASEALKAAELCEDEYQRGAVASWPIAALVERRRFKSAAAALARAREHALMAQPVGSRAQALSLLLEAGGDLGAKSRLQLINDLMQLQGERTHWRAARAIVHALKGLSHGDRVLAERLATTIVVASVRRRALAAIAEAGPTAS